MEGFQYSSSNLAQQQLAHEARGDQQQKDPEGEALVLPHVRREHRQRRHAPHDRHEQQPKASLGALSVS